MKNSIKDKIRLKDTPKRTKLHYSSKYSQMSMPLNLKQIYTYESKSLLPPDPPPPLSILCYSPPPNSSTSPDFCQVRRPCMYTILTRVTPYSVTSTHLTLDPWSTISYLFHTFLATLVPDQTSGTSLF